MISSNIAELRLHLDLEGKYVDFSILRNALTVLRIIGDLDISLSEANKEGECRGGCPKCQKEKSFSLNVNTIRFNCFAKGCNLKGGGAIDFFAKLNAVSAKEASHLLAYAYGIQPYDQEMSATANLMNEKLIVAAAANTVVKREVSKPLPDMVQNIPQFTAEHLIASIRRDLTELEQLLISR